MALKEYQLLYLDNDIPINRSFYCNNGDVKSRGLEVHVLDNSQAKDCTGLSLKMIIKVPSGDLFEATVANGLVTVLNAAEGIYQILFPNNMGRGRLIAELQLSNIVPEVIVSRKFSLVSDGSLTSDGVISELPKAGILWDIIKNEAQRQADFVEVLGSLDEEVALKYAGLEAEYATDLTGVKSQLAETQTEFQQVIANATIDSEVINARGGKANLDARLDGFDTSLVDITNKSLKVKNSVANGDFSGGATGWEAVSPTTSLAVASNELTANLSVAGTYVAVQTDIGSGAIGDKIYIAGTLNIINASASTYGFYLRSGVSTIVGGGGTNLTSAAGFKSIVLDITVTPVSNIRVAVRANVAVSAIFGVKCKKIITVNLTQVFGIGNEPTRAEMDMLITILGGWFNGEIGITEKQLAIWTLNMIRQNRTAIVALGGTIV